MNTVIAEQFYTASELHRLAVQRSGRRIGRTQFYEWLKVCLIEPSGEQYTEHDLERLVFYGKALKEFRRVKAAKALLYNELGLLGE